MTELGMVVFWQPVMSVLEAVSMMALQLLRESYFVLPLATTMLVNPLQPSKADLPIEVTELGMVILDRLLQSSNADSPIEVTELGILMLVRLLQSSNADPPKEVTELGILMVDRLEHL